MFQRIVCVEDIVDIFYEKIIVFKIKQDAEVQEDTGAESYPVPKSPMCRILTDKG